MFRKRIRCRAIDNTEHILVQPVGFVPYFFRLQVIQCDVYMQNPRGSNNRLNGQQANRQNNNRLFDSQNNAKGGYNVGNTYHQRRDEEELQYNMKYFMSGEPGSGGKTRLFIEWTNQHGCGNKDLNCNIVLQYMSQDNRYGEVREMGKDTMRNGRSTATPAYSKRNIGNNYRSDLKSRKREVRTERGMHEPWEWYDKCAKRQRNKGLFTADQTLKKDFATNTRQNPNGGRSGYECPEERDYYPYWHPTDWVDIAVLADSTERCDYYKENSFNTATKGECLDAIIENQRKSGFKHYSEHNNPEACRNAGKVWVQFNNYLEQKPEHGTEGSCTSAGYKWGFPYRSLDLPALEVDQDTGLPKKSCFVPLPTVDCKKAMFTRTNHLGNAGNSLTANYTWELPYFSSQVEKRFILRIRYNISTMDYDGYNTFSDKNGDNSPVENDPTVDATKYNIPLQLAVNTAQFGRTFQDRSHIFIIAPRAQSGIAEDLTIHNVNVRGKRGNIVQTYPATEYDFVPKDITLTTNEAVLFQWTGSNNNPQNNAGEGRAGTDRSNIVEMDDAGLNVRFADPSRTSGMFKDAVMLWSDNKCTKTMEDVEVSLASAGYYCGVSNRDTGELRVQKFRDNENLRGRKFQDQLDNSSPSFSGVLLRWPQAASYYYMCTRNNNFSNRNQKAFINVIAS